MTDGVFCLASAVVDGLVAICDRPEGHQPATVHYDVELDRAWASADFGRPARAALGRGGAADQEQPQDDNRPKGWAAHKYRYSACFGAKKNPFRFPSCGSALAPSE